MATLYLLHFARPYWGRARHYVGYTKLPLEQRLGRHRSGKGSLLVAYALRRGIDFVLARTWSYDDPKEARQAELQLKRDRNLPRLCPSCREGERSAAAN